MVLSRTRSATVSIGAPSVGRWRYRHTVLALCVSSYFAIRFAQLVISPLVPEIIGALAISRSAVGLAFTGMWAAYALSQLPSGIFGDRFGERRVVLAALGLTAAGTFATANAPTYVAFVGFVVVLGVGAGLYYNAATALLARLFDEVGSAIGVHRIGAQVAGLAAPVVATLVLGYGWRVSVMTGVAVTGAVLFAFAARVRPVEPADSTASLRTEADPRTLVGLLKRREIAISTVFATLGEFVTLATMAFLPTFLVEHHSLGIGVAGSLFSGYYAIVAVSQPVSGWLSDRVGRDSTLALTTVAGSAGFGLLVLGASLTAVLPAIGLVGFAMSWGAPLQSRVMDALDAADRGVGFGLVRMLYILLGAAGNAVVGALADVAGWDAAFGLLGGLFGVAFLVLVAHRAFGCGG